MSVPSRPELIFGLVGPLGTDLNLVSDLLISSLEKVRYTSEKIVLSDLLSEIDGLTCKEKNFPENDRIESRMDRGDELRNKVGGMLWQFCLWGKFKNQELKKRETLKKALSMIDSLII